MTEQRPSCPVIWSGMRGRPSGVRSNFGHPHGAPIVRMRALRGRGKDPLAIRPFAVTRIIPPQTHSAQTRQVPLRALCARSRPLAFCALCTRSGLLAARRRRRHDGEARWGSSGQPDLSDVMRAHPYRIVMSDERSDVTIRCGSRLLLGGKEVGAGAAVFIMAPGSRANACRFVICGVRPVCYNPIRKPPPAGR